MIIVTGQWYQYMDEEEMVAAKVVSIQGVVVHWIDWEDFEWAETLEDAKSNAIRKLD